MTGDGWLSGIGRPLIVYSPASAFYLITYFLLTSLVLTNVVIAVLLDKFVGGDIPDLTPEEMQIEMMLDKLAEDKDTMEEEMEMELPEELKGWLVSNTFKKAGARRPTSTSSAYVPCICSLDTSLCTCASVCLDSDSRSFTLARTRVADYSADLLASVVLRVLLLPGHRSA